MRFNGDSVLKEFRKFFIKRLTEPGTSDDKRKEEYNSPLYLWYDDEEKSIKNAHATKPEIRLKEIMNKFDSAVKDYSKECSSKK